MKKKLNKKIVVSFILGATIFGCLGVGATSLIYSKDVSYDNTLSGLKSTTVQGALDELYEKAKTAPSCNSEGECTVICPENKIFETIDNGYRCFAIKSNNFIKQINETVVTSGDGLYQDTVTDGRYYYRGENPNNYITFNDEIWRIISIENNGTLKIIRNEQLSKTQSWDFGRKQNKNTYCTGDSGCNAWAATSNLIGYQKNFVQCYPNGSLSDNVCYSGTVTQDSAMLTYLNETYYDSLPSGMKAKVVKGIFNVSTPGNDQGDYESLEIDAEQEKQYQWKGYVALYTVTELLRASINSGCTNLNGAQKYNSYCSQNNWLWTASLGAEEWSLSPIVSSSSQTSWLIQPSYLASMLNNYSFGIRPVLYLSSDITLSGQGTSNSPYIIN